MPELDLASPSGFQVQPPVCKRHPTLQVSSGQPQRPPPLARKKAQPFLNPAPGISCLQAVSLMWGPGGWERADGKPAATSKPVMHDGLCMWLLPGLREPPWKFGESLLTFWSMILGSQLTSGAVFGEQVGCRLPNVSPEELVFSKLLLGIMLGAYIYIPYFCMPFAKWCCFAQDKSC